MARHSWSSVQSNLEKYLANRPLPAGCVSAVTHVSLTGTSLKWERGKESCYCSLLFDYNRETKIVGPLKTVVSWSSTNRTVVEALNAIALYRDVTELCAELESTFNYESELKA